jgi:hypothetical protein
MERRKHVRRNNQLSLEAIQDTSGARLGRIVDLSPGGAMLYCPTLPTEDSLWRCRIVSTEHSDPIHELRLTLDCLWTRPASDGPGGWAGFQIIGIDENQQAALHRILDALAPRDERAT